MPMVAKVFIVIQIMPARKLDLGGSGFWGVFSLFEARSSSSSRTPCSKSVDFLPGEPVEATFSISMPPALLAVDSRDGDWAMSPIVSGREAKYKCLY